MAAKILIIDHYDSFTFNLVQLLEEAGNYSVKVVQVDDADLSILPAYDGIILSPGPGLPGDYPLVFDILSYCTGGVKKVPVLGICLGLQAMVVFFGGSLYNLGTLQHGTQIDLVPRAPCPLFTNLSFPITAGRYHSWAVDPQTLPSVFAVTSVASEGPQLKKQADAIIEQDVLQSHSLDTIMSVHHRDLPLFGLQFHPESYMTPEGLAIIQNWLSIVIGEKITQSEQYVDNTID